MAKKRTKENAENTLGMENTIRIRYLLDRVKGEYYANGRVGQRVTLDDAKRAEAARASPESTLRILVWAKYLFLEMWMHGLLGMQPGEGVREMEREGHLELKRIMEGMEGSGHAGLAETFRRDLETMKLAAVMRNRYSAHPTFPLGEAMSKMGGFARFWQCARRLLLLRGPGGIRSRGQRTPCGPVAGAGAPGLPYGLPAEGELEDMKRRYECPRREAKWPGEDTRQIMQECAACVRVLLGEFMFSLKLHAGHPSGTSKARLCDTAWMLKYVVLDMHYLIELYCELVREGRLEALGSPGFLARRGAYKRYRNHYAAHVDEGGGVVSLVQLLGDKKFAPMLVLDMHEMALLSERLFPDLRPDGRIGLPSGAEIARMDGEVDAVRRELREKFGDGFADAEHERLCGEFQARVRGMCGLA